MGLRAAGAQCFVARLAEGLDLGCAATPRLRASGGATRLAANCSEVPRQALFQLSYAGRGGSASIRTKDLRVMSPALWAAELRNRLSGTR